MLQPVAEPCTPPPHGADRGAPTSTSIYGLRGPSFLEPRQLARVKAKTGMSVSLCTPAPRDRGDLDRAAQPLVDEVISLDALAHDDAGRGARLWRAAASAIGDIIVFCDASDPDVGRQLGLLLRPLLTDPRVQLVKGAHAQGPRGASQSGRAADLLARPLLSLLRPELAFIQQPTSPTCAARRGALEQLCFEVGEGVDVGLLLDTADLFGADRVVEVRLGARSGSDDLALSESASREIAHTILERTGHLPQGCSSRRCPPLQTLLSH